MSDAVQPTAAEVRAAAEAVKAALDRHLAAVERRTGDDDPDVYDEIQSAEAAQDAADHEARKVLRDQRRAERKDKWEQFADKVTSSLA